MQAVTITQITPSELEALIENSIRKILGKQLYNSSSDEEHLLTIQQAAEFLSLSVPTIYGLVKKAEIPVSKKSRRLYFCKQELSEWVKAGRRKTNAEIGSEADNYLSKKKRLTYGR